MFFGPMPLLTRHGEPLLYLPRNRALVPAALGFYQPQTRKARFGVRILQALAALRLPLPLTSQIPEVPQDPSWLTFIRHADERPDVALLCGNARAIGRRFMILTFDSNGQPSRVIKYGTSSEARHLIEQEKELLQQAALTFPCLPQVLEVYQSSEVSALALPYYAGDPVGAEDMPLVEKFLAGLAYPDRTVPLTSLPVWQALTAVPNLPESIRSLGQQAIHPVLMHGDFAAWNMRKARGTLLVFDWEKAHLEGVPGWDWLHFQLQNRLLVEKMPPQEAGRQLRQCGQSPIWHNFCAQAGLPGREHLLLEAFLWYYVHVWCGLSEKRQFIPLLQHS